MTKTEQMQFQISEIREYMRTCQSLQAILMYKQRIDYLQAYILIENYNKKTIK